MDGTIPLKEFLEAPDAPEWSDRGAQVLEVLKATPNTPWEFTSLRNKLNVPTKAAGGFGVTIKSLVKRGDVIARRIEREDGSQGYFIALKSSIDDANHAKEPVKKPKE